MNLKILYKSFSILFVGALAGTALASDIPAGSCQPSSSISVMVVGRDVFSFVPKGAWSDPQKDIVLVKVEPDGIPVKKIPTSKAVSSCASNPRTGQTVCTTNDTDVYVLTGAMITSTLKSSAVGVSTFLGGLCMNCGVTMDAVHNDALIGLSLSPRSGFQFVDLGRKPELDPAFPSQAPMAYNPGGEISKGILIDPIRNWILSPNESGNYEIIKVGSKDNKKDNKKDDEDKDKDRKSAKDNNRKDDADDGDSDDNKKGDRNQRGFFENAVSPFMSFGSAGEDCSTGIALATLEGSVPSDLYIADLTQAMFTPGSPGQWSAPRKSSQIKTLSESLFVPPSSFDLPGPAGVGVAQGTHIGVVIGMKSDSITAIRLPASSGNGTPDIKDWVTCRILTLTGTAPHTVNAYQSPKNGHAIALVRDWSATTLTAIDLTQMLNLPRATPHTCASSVLPPTVMRTIPVP